MIARYARLSSFHARQLLRVPFFLQQALAAPLAFEVLRTLGLAGAGAAVPGNLWFLAGTAGMWSTTTLAVGIIGFQRFQGTLEHLAMSTLPPGVVFGSLASSAALIGVIGYPLSFVAQLVTGGQPEVAASDIVGAVVATIACAASASLLAALFVLIRAATVFEPLVLTPVWLLTGVAVPLTAFPSWTTSFATLHPLTSAVQVADQRTLGGAAVMVLVSLGVSTLWVIIAAVAARAALRRARVVGSLGLA